MRFFNVENQPVSVTYIYQPPAQTLEHKMLHKHHSHMRARTVMWIICGVCVGLCALCAVTMTTQRAHMLLLMFHGIC